MRRLFYSLLLVPCLAYAQDYNRAEWRHWVDYDGDCQDTRHEILIATSIDQVTLDERGCRAVRGVWFDQYTGSVFTNSLQLDLDHIVPLAYAHEHGAAEWSPLLKELFANDPDNLILVSLSANRSKGAKGPSQYLPRIQHQCEYAERWKRVASRYRLQLAGPDIVTLLTLCPARR